MQFKPNSKLQKRNSRFIQRQKRLETVYHEADPTTKMLLVTRKLGHKEDIPGSGRWQVYTCRHHGQSDCWICDRQIYSMVFWNEKIGDIEMLKYKDDDLQFIIQHLQRINSADEQSIERQHTEEKLVQEKTMPDNSLRTNPDVAMLSRSLKNRPLVSAPVIYGQFTNWEPKKMVDIRQYCELLNRENKPDIFDLCKK